MTVSTDKDGNVNIEELRQKAEQAGNKLAALMITYPSTHGMKGCGLGCVQQSKQVITLQHTCAITNDGGGVMGMVG